MQHYSIDFELNLRKDAIYNILEILEKTILHLLVYEHRARL